MQRVSYIIDTDAGTDDLMALAFLLARGDIHIEAVTIAYGLAHAARGAANVSRILALAGRSAIPVYIGDAQPSQGHAAFPDQWRSLSDDLPGVALPESFAAPQQESAASFLQRRVLVGSKPVRILALGAMTTMAEICEGPAPALQDIVIMGAAFGVGGNAGAAEWNIFVDPLAAHRVFTSQISQLIVPLDATNDVPVTSAFIDSFHAVECGPLGRLTGQVLEVTRRYANLGVYYAWDMLAAVALLDPSVVRTKEHAVAVTQTPPEMGATRRARHGPKKTIAYGAGTARFQQLFFAPFAA